MNIEDKLTILIVEKYGSMRNFAKAIEMSPSTLATIMQRGIHNASVQNVIKICHGLDISTDELAQNRIIPSNLKQEQDLRLLAYAKELTKILQLGREYKQAYEPYTIDGIEMSQEETETFLDGIEIITNLIRKERARKEIQAQFETQTENKAQQSYAQQTEHNSNNDGYFYA